MLQPLLEYPGSYERVANQYFQQAEEWLYFHQGTARATAFIGNANARTFDFRAGDTAVFPDNSG